MIDAPFRPANERSKSVSVAVPRGLKKALEIRAPVDQCIGEAPQGFGLSARCHRGRGHRTVSRFGRLSHFLGRFRVLDVPKKIPPLVLLYDQAGSAANGKTATANIEHSTLDVER